MKARHSILAFALLAIVASGAEAQDKWYWGLSGGQAIFQEQGFDSTLQGGATVGHWLVTGPRGSLAVEGELSTTLSKGDVNFRSDQFPFTVPGEWDITTVGFSFVYRAPWQFYPTGNVGYVWANGETNAPGAMTVNFDDAEWQAGVGLGLRLGAKRRVELRYTVIPFSGEKNDVALLMGGIVF